MKKRIALAMLLMIAGMCQASAITLEGSVEKADVEKHHRGFWERLFGRREEPEGRIGVRISTSGTIGYVHPGSPAERAGLQADDHVLLVDGRKHNVENISGDPGTKVHLELKRRGSEDRIAVDVERVDFHEIGP